jgi:glycosyltransferase involved in cell wall biosynthesis
MKIALVVPGGVDRSGEYRVIPALLALIAHLAERHEIHVFDLYQEPLPGEWELAGARIHNVGTHATYSRAIGAIVRHHRAQPFDAVQSIWSGSCGLIAVAAGALLRIPSLVHIAGGELTALRDIDYGGCLKRRGRLREALTLHMASQVTAASAPILASIAAAGVHAERVPLGIDLKSWPPRAPMRRDPRARLRLLHVASLNRVKDQRTLLRAIALLVADGERLHLDVVGEDVLDGEIQRLAMSLGLSNHVTFHGFLTQRELRPFVESAHLLLMSSRHEAGPIVLLEAAAVGVPTVGTAVGHIAEWAPTAASAVPVNDPAALADAVRRLAQDEALRLRVAHAAFERAVVENAAFTAQCFERMYERLRQRKSAGDECHA